MSLAILFLLLNRMCMFQVRHRNGTMYLQENKNGIEYCICVFPVGGYVQMPENQNTVPEGKIVFADAPLLLRLDTHGRISL